jgi:predicted  nucleic acid-binding Zn-ribbon protein
MAGHGHGERSPDPGTRLVLEELRDLRAEMRADRTDLRAERRAERAEMRAERRQSDERFARIMRDVHEAFKDIRTVGLSIVKTLNHHTRILERIDRKLSARGNGRPGQGNGGASSPRR